MANDVQGQSQSTLYLQRSCWKLTGIHFLKRSLMNCSFSLPDKHLKFWKILVVFSFCIHFIFTWQTSHSPAWCRDGWCPRCGWTPRLSEDLTRIAAILPKIDERPPSQFCVFYYLKFERIKLQEYLAFCLCESVVSPAAPTVDLLLRLTFVCSNFKCGFWNCYDRAIFTGWKVHHQKDILSLKDP